MEQLDQLLTETGLRKTEIRKRILRVFWEADAALSQADIEDAIEDIDRITLYRNLRAFESNGLIHKALDTTHLVKYAICKDACIGSQHHHDNHLHFHCTQCGNTYCVEEVTVGIPRFSQADRVDYISLVAEGKCKYC